MRKRIMASIAAGFFIVAALATPASADWGDDDDHDDDGPRDCPRHAVCFWEEERFEGDMSVRWNWDREHGDDNDDDDDERCHRAPDHQIGSVVNNSRHSVKLYEDRHCDDLTEVVYPHDWEWSVDAKSWK